MSVEQGFNQSVINTEPWVGILGDGIEGVPAGHPLSQLAATYDQAPNKVLGFLNDPLVAAPDLAAYEARVAEQAAEGKRERAALSAEEQALVGRIHGVLLSATVKTTQGPRILFDYDNETYGAQRRDPGYMARLRQFQETRNGSPYLEENRRSLALAGLRVSLERRSAWREQEAQAHVISLDEITDTEAASGSATQQSDLSAGIGWPPRVPEQRQFLVQDPIDLRPAM